MDDNKRIKALSAVTPDVSSDTDMKVWITKFKRDAADKGIKESPKAFNDAGQEEGTGFIVTNNVIEAKVKAGSAAYNIVLKHVDRVNNNTISLIGELVKELTKPETYQEWYNKFDSITMSSLNEYNIVSWSNMVIAHANKADIKDESTVCRKCRDGLSQEWKDKLEVNGLVANTKNDWLIEANRMQIAHSKGISNKSNAITTVALIQNNSFGQNRDEVVCRKCNGTGHYAKECASGKPYFSMNSRERGRGTSRWRDRGRGRGRGRAWKKPR